MSCKFRQDSQLAAPDQRKQAHGCNQTLRRELGLRLGLPRFKWMFSESVMHPVRSRSSQDGLELEWDWRCACGINIADDAHASDCNKAVIAEPVYAIIRRMHGYTNKDGSPIEYQWVLWGWVPPPTPDEWNAQFGTLLDFAEYANGAYEPVTLGTLIACVRTQHEAPTMDTTWFFIRKFRERERISTEQLIRMGAAQERVRRLQRLANIKDRYVDKVSSMGGRSIPGKKGQVAYQSGPRFAYKPSPGEERLLIKPDTRTSPQPAHNESKR